MPLEQFEAEEKGALLPAPREHYDVPLWCEPLIARDQCAQVAKALYSLPTRFVGKHLRARANRSTVRFYDGALLVKAHARQAPGGKSIDASDYPEHKTAYAMRDVAFLEQQARKRGASIGRFAHALLDARCLGRACAACTRCSPSPSATETRASRMPAPPNSQSR